MGLKGAGSYFQRMMCCEVLAGLILEICESYLDDVIVFGQTEKEFLRNLREVYDRFKAYNITLNPAKCRYGLSEIEYVGHVINENGLTFTRSKLDSVVNFPQPQTHKSMLSFLGLANYFRAHVKNHSTVAKPLHDMLVNYKRNQRLVWNPVAVAAFEELKALIDKCPLLYFPREKGEIYLQTDASNDGIGAYLFQRVKNDDGTVEDLPIEFISKAFTKEQKRWSTPEQEAYAIFYALRKFDYLLRDVHFVLQTDHKNLIYINSDGSAKVKRWKLLLQEYNFDIEHIRGIHNVIADAFSRLCHFFDLEEPQPLATVLAIMCMTDEHDERDREISVEFNAFYNDLSEAEQAVDDYVGSTTYKGAEQFWALDEVKHQEELMFLKEQSVKPNVALPPDVYENIKAVHNALAGHKGVKNTLRRLAKKKVKFPNMHKSVAKFIKECSFCQKMSHRKRETLTLPFTLAKNNVMLQLYLDSIGPLTKDDEGYQHILTVIDGFTRWVMLYPLKTLDAKECSQALIQHFGIFGVPSVITSDGSTQFNNEIVMDIIRLVGAEYSVTLAYSHQENAIVERSNKEIVTHLRAFLFDNGIGKSFRQYLPFVQRTINAEVVDSIGVSPARILFGSAVDLDRGIFMPNQMQEQHDHGDLSDYVNKLVEIQKETIRFAAREQQARDAAYKLKSVTAKTGEPTQFKERDFVLLDYPSNGFTRPGPPHKLMTQKRGPLQVISNEGPNYRLQDIATGRQTNAHVSRLTEFRFDPTRVDPLAIAVKDTDQLIVERVLNHRGFTGQGNTNRREDLELLVQWVGQVEPDWQPWRNFHNNLAAHVYMNTIPYLRSILNPQYRLQIGGGGAPDRPPKPPKPIVPEAVYVPVESDIPVPERRTKQKISYSGM